MAPPLKLGNFGGKSSPGSERPIFGPRGWHNRLTDRHNQPRLESRCRVVRKSLRGHFERASRYSQKTQEQTIAQTQTKTKDDGMTKQAKKKKAHANNKSTLEAASCGGVCFEGFWRTQITFYQVKWLKV